MGSLASRPKAPSVARTVYVPVYNTPASSAPSTPLPTGQVDTPAGSPGSATQGEDTSARRSASLLERRRGILSQSAVEPRKTLLGE